METDGTRSSLPDIIVECFGNRSAADSSVDDMTSLVLQDSLAGTTWTGQKKGEVMVLLSNTVVAQQVR